MDYNYNKKSIWKWILLYAAVAAIAYGLVYYFFFYNKGGYNQNSQYPITNSQQNAETSDWKTYKNDEYGFQFQYPDNWTVDVPTIGIYWPELHVFVDRPSGNFDWTLESGENYPKGDMRFIIETEKETKYNVDELFSSYEKIFKDFGYNYKEVGGQKAFRYVQKVNASTEQGGTGTFISYTLSKNHYFYLITIRYSKYSDGVGEKIISTFKFTPVK